MSSCTHICADIHVASFFSIHRPISVTKSVPPPSSNSAFSSIFSARERQRHQPADAIYTISSAIDHLEDLTAQSQDQQMRRNGKDLHDAVVQSSASNSEMPNSQHLDGIRPQIMHINIEELAKRFQPFKPPPAPVPLNQAQPSASQKSSSEKRRTIQKSYSARLFIIEDIHPDGQTTYRTHTSPLREEPTTDESRGANLPPAPHQPFLKRMLERQRHLREWRNKGDRKETWRSISVKRQRKLKMKKHKYKKLMRRTRNLRRRLDRN